MLRALSLVLLAWASIAGGAHAQVVDVPRPYAIPLPPMSNPEPQWELGLRYWYSEGSTRFDINSQRQNPILGNPTSTLTYDGIDANSLEFVFAVRNETRTFFKGFVGGGWLDNGSLDDEDFFAGQIKFSDTYSQLDGDGMVYGIMDVGQDFTLIDRKARVVLSPFVGFNYWEESVDGYGARCNRDDVGGLFCGPPGSTLVPFGTKVINNTAPRRRAQGQTLGPAHPAHRRRHSPGRVSVERRQPLPALGSRTRAQYRGQRHRLGLSARSRGPARRHRPLGARRSAPACAIGTPRPMARATLSISG